MTAVNAGAHLFALNPNQQVAANVAHQATCLRQLAARAGIRALPGPSSQRSGDRGHAASRKPIAP